VVDGCPQPDLVFWAIAWNERIVARSELLADSLTSRFAGSVFIFSPLGFGVIWKPYGAGIQF
jgi:hypothetical protein